jgi:hypothetical protein
VNAEPRNGAFAWSEIVLSEPYLPFTIEQWVDAVFHVPESLFDYCAELPVGDPDAAVSG